MRKPERVILIGPSGSGKSTTSKMLAERLGFDCIDTDERITERIGMSISECFARFGEPAFRAIESQVLAEVCTAQHVVIATGGGIVLSPANWTFMRPRSVIVSVSGSPKTLVQRVREHAAQAGDAAERPLLSGDAEERMAGMLAARGALYAAADACIDTDGRSVEEVADLVFREVARIAESGVLPHLSLGTALGRSDIYAGAGLRFAAPRLVQHRWPRASRVWVLSDARVARLWGDAIRDSFEGAGLRVSSLEVEPGEDSKHFSEVARLCEEMTAGGVTRRDVVIALGGGVVGDLGGFVASICLRGLALLQMPTSLLAMVDSSVGGKTGVNLLAGKNLAGAFYQPGIVVIDPDFLRSLSEAEYRSGMAEVVKHALIQPATPFGGTTLHELLAEIALDPMPLDVLTDVLKLNVAIKHSVVQADEREDDLRMVLNFGHTAGHAIEADGYRYRHGEAVGLGLLVASRIATLLGRVGPEYEKRVAILLERAGLPTAFEGDLGAVIMRLSRDKKNVDGSLRWILPNSAGIVEPVSGVATEVVEQALRAFHTTQ
jgi:shikimate kinase / 3-dehydroquinate synthase